MWEIIENEGLVEIRIPFIRKVIWNDIQHPRSFPFFKDIIRCMTLFKIRQREKHGDFYMSTIEDFEAAKKMYKMMEATNATKLNSKEIAVLTYLSDRYQEWKSAHGDAFTNLPSKYRNEALSNIGKVSRPELIAALSKDFKTNQQQIKYILHGKNNSGGLLNKVSGLQAEEMINSVFGTNKMWWYWYSGNITSDGFVDTIILDIIQAEEETNRWIEGMRAI
jgi:hypothetical protein